MNILNYQDDYVQSLKWEWDILEIVEQASQNLGIEAWGSTGLFYRPFFNGRFGPCQDGFDKDVCVRSVGEARILWTYLNQHHPHVRWSIFSGERENKEYGIESPHWAVQAGRPLLFRVGAVRLRDAKIETLMSKEAYDSLLSGKMEVNLSPYNIKKDNVQKEKFRFSAISRAAKAKSEYPGLIYGPSFDLIGYDDRTNSIGEDDQISKKIDYKKQTLEVTTNDNLYSKKKTVNSFVEGLSYHKPVFRSPDKLPFPLALQEAAYLKSKKEAYFDLSEEEEKLLGNAGSITPPNGTSSWAEQCFMYENDQPFKEWLSNQMRSRNPLGGKDKYIDSVISGNIFGKEFAIEVNKPHYSGWSWNKYTKEKMFVLDSEKIAELNIPFKASIRLASLFFDIDTRSALPLSTKKKTALNMWNEAKPSWLSQDEEGVTTELIAGQYEFLGLLNSALCTDKGRMTDTTLEFYQEDYSSLKQTIMSLSKRGLNENQSLHAITICAQAHLAAVSDLQILSKNLQNIGNILFGQNLPDNPHTLKYAL